ncbi:hypothetical protein AB0J83_13065 [Actinoplanes sp. NPDC049596]|uniref:hypothetical protein n=1 Tax=unclassified Actinoplanes TaxID=2626549 RepID=UPI003431023E
MADEDLTAEERELFARAEAEALAGLTFDYEAGLADLRARPFPPGPFVPRPRSGSAWGARVRMGVVGLVLLASFGTSVGLQRVMSQEEVAEPPLFSAPSPARVTPAPGTSTRDGDRVGPGGAAASLGRPAVSPPVTPPSGRPGPSSTPSAQLSRPFTQPGPPSAEPTWPSDAEPTRSSAQPTRSSAQPTRPDSESPPSKPGSSSPSPSSPPAEEPPFPSTFHVRYQATLVPVPLGGAGTGTGTPSLELTEPKVVDDGPVRISGAPGTGDSVLTNDAGVLTAVVPSPGAGPDDCAAALRETTGSESPVPLREDRSYCLMTASRGEPRTLVRLTVEQPEQDGEILLRVKAWDVTP